MKIDKTSFVPLYLQIEQQLTERISVGEIKPGDPIPTEAALCDIYGVSRMTARKAVDYLVRQGRVERFRGRGTFVVKKALTRKVNMPLDRHLTSSELAVEVRAQSENRVL
ncbi:MAG: GntR family transcriptional regulator, partial [Ewingella sp.]|nr:GntR family transcriptional regulator [Ewingella sp.]